jgi:hypothetical protein
MDQVAEVPIGPQTLEHDFRQPGAPSSCATPGTLCGLLNPSLFYKGNWFDVYWELL